MRIAKLILILFAVTAMFFTGCVTAKPSTVQPIEVKTTITSEQIKEATVKPTVQINENTTANDYALLINDTLVNLKDWDSDVNLDEVFGAPLTEKVEEVGNAGQLTGSFVKTLMYDGLQIELFSPKQNGKTFWIREIKVMNDFYLTASGIRVGMKLSDLKTVYPDIPIFLDGRTDPNNCAYVITIPDTYDYAIYEVKDGTIVEIRIYSEIN